MDFYILTLSIKGLDSCGCYDYFWLDFSWYFILSDDWQHNYDLLATFTQQLDVRLAPRTVPVAVVVKKTEPGAVKTEEEQDEEELERAKESISRIRKGLMISLNNVKWITLRIDRDWVLM